MKEDKEKLVYVNVVGNLIKVIAHSEAQQEYVIDTMVKPGNCVFEGFEPWLVPKSFDAGDPSPKRSILAY